MPKPLRHYESAAKRAICKISEQLEGQLHAAAIGASLRNPKADVVAISAMGTWFLEVDGEERRPPCFRTFEKMLQKFGWAAIPAPVMFKAKNGQAVKSVDW